MAISKDHACMAAGARDHRVRFKRETVVSVMRIDGYLDERYEPPAPFVRRAHWAA